jgi:formylglycine-generating enzyme required for sulfatase activity
MADASGNNANYDGACGSPYWRTEAGELKNSDSPYGTFDQGGNVHEWNEAVLNSPHRVTRGGSLGLYNDPYLTAAVRNDYSPSGEDYTIGFRVVDVPEPCTLSLLALGGLAILRRRLGTSCSI